MKKIILTLLGFCTMVYVFAYIHRDDTSMYSIDSNTDEDYMFLDSATYMDMFMPAVESDTIGRYSVVSEGDKYGIIDKWNEQSVTPVEFDVLYYAQRVIYDDRADVLFVMQRGNDVGIIRIKENDNSYELEILENAPSLK